MKFLRSTKLKTIAMIAVTAILAGCWEDEGGLGLLEIGGSAQPFRGTPTGNLMYACSDGQSGPIIIDDTNGVINFNMFAVAESLGMVHDGFPMYILRTSNFGIGNNFYHIVGIKFDQRTGIFLRPNGVHENVTFTNRPALLARTRQIINSRAYDRIDCTFEPASDSQVMTWYRNR